MTAMASSRCWWFALALVACSSGGGAGGSGSGGALPTGGTGCAASGTGGRAASEAKDAGGEAGRADAPRDGDTSEGARDLAPSFDGRGPDAGDVSDARPLPRYVGRMDFGDSKGP